MDKIEHPYFQRWSSALQDDEDLRPFLNLQKDKNFGSLAKNSDMDLKQSNPIKC